MSVLQTQPQNLNILSSTGFKFSIKKLPTTNFFCQSITVPGLKLAFTEQPTPFININYYGDKVIYNDFTITFAVDEDLRNYREIYEWLEGLGRPVSFEERRELDRKESILEGKRSDISILIATNTKNPNIQVNIQDAFPISISDLQFSATTRDEAFLVAAAVFKYTNISVQRIL